MRYSGSGDGSGSCAALAEGKMNGWEHIGDNVGSDVTEEEIEAGTDSSLIDR